MDKMLWKNVEKSREEHEAITVQIIAFDAKSNTVNIQATSEHSGKTYHAVFVLKNNTVQRINRVDVPAPFLQKMRAVAMAKFAQIRDRSAQKDFEKLHQRELFGDVK